MSRTILLALAVGAVGACGSSYVLHGSHSDPARPRSGRGSMVELPAEGTARGDVLRDGWPVWVVRHDDGSATVLNAVAPPHSRSAATLFASRAELVRWLPTTRRFVADDVAYDEYGRVLGHATDDSCVANCPRVIDPAFDQRDLDRFSAMVAFDKVIVDELVPSRPIDDAPEWIDWDRAAPIPRVLAVGPDDRSPAAVQVGDALHLPFGSYAIVAGSIVQSTSAPPRICADTPRCAACDPDSPLALGVARVTVDRPAVHAESGTILVRREPTGLAVIATTRAGACPSS